MIKTRIYIDRAIGKAEIVQTDFKGQLHNRETQNLISRYLTIDEVIEKIKSWYKEPKIFEVEL